MYHDFWLLRGDEYSYKDYVSFFRKKDAPVRFHDELLRYFADTLAWIPTCNPAKDGMPTGNGLNWYGPTVINQSGGSHFHHICFAWSQLFRQGPEQITLRGPFEWQWPFNEAEHMLHEDQIFTLGKYSHLNVARSWLVESLETLAHFGEQAATGSFFLLHIGI